MGTPLGSMGRIPGHRESKGNNISIGPILFFGVIFFIGILTIHFGPVCIYPYHLPAPTGTHYVIFTVLRIVGSISSLATMGMIMMGMRLRFILAAAVLTILGSGIVYLRVTAMTGLAVIGLLLIVASAEKFVLDYEENHKRNPSEEDEDEDWLV